MSNLPTETDLVVIGSGVSGLAAAIMAAEKGVRVVVYEKQRSFGGTSNFFDGMFGVESDMQKQRYITYSRDDAFKSIMEMSHWRANPRLVRAYVDLSGETIGWLQDMGVEFSDATINMPDSPLTYHVVKGQGAAVIKAMATKAKELGVVLQSGATVKSIQKQGGSITGVIADIDEEDIPIKTRAVVIASGGFLNNKAWVKKYSGFELDVNLFQIGNVDKMGDGIRMAWEVGAAEEGIRVLELFRAGPIGPDFPMKCQHELVAAQPDLWVDPQGFRFCDEGIAFFDTNVGNANARFNEGYTYSMFDDSIIQILIDKGIERGVGMDNPPGTKPSKFYEEFNAVMEKGTTEVFMAESIPALAEKMGVDPNVLTATVEEYNEYCEKGHDDLFAKNPRFLRPLVGPKYYAAKVRTVCLGTMGGIKIDHNARVIDKKGGVIPGLFAVGLDAGGLYGNDYCIKGSSGTASSYAANSGRIAGISAATFLGK